MNSRTRITRLIAQEPADHNGFWLGNPDPATWPILHAYFGTSSEEDLRQKLGDDFRWFAPDVQIQSYFHPNGRWFFHDPLDMERRNQEPPFTNCTEIETRKAVRDAFEAAGRGGGFILSPSDHFFEGELNLIAAFADEAKKCTY